MALQPRLRCADRKSLLLGTALASTLLLAGMLTPSPAHATTDCLALSPPPPNPIFVNVADSIVCVNNDPRNGAAYAIYLYTTAPDGYIDLFNSGDLVTNNVLFTTGILAVSEGAANVQSPIGIENTGDISVTSETGNATGIFSFTRADENPIAVVNTGDITATTEGLAASFGISASTAGNESPVSIANGGAINSIGGSFAFGINAQSTGYDSPLSIVNEGNITGVGGIIISVGLEANTYRGNSPISVVNAGDISMFSTDASTFGFRVITNGVNNFDSPVSLVNSGDIVSETTGTYAAALGIYARTNGPVNNPISIVSSGDIAAISEIQATGILAETRGDDSPLSIVNSGNIETRGSGQTLEPLNGGIFADTFGVNSPISIVNSGDITSTGEENYVFGIFGRIAYNGGPLTIENSGEISVDAGTGVASGIRGLAVGYNNPIAITNRANIAVTGTEAFGVHAVTVGLGNPIDIVNSGDIGATANGSYVFNRAHGIYAVTIGPDSPITIRNSGSIYATSTYSEGVYAYSLASDIVIVNTGSISASSLLAINTEGTGRATIYNYGGGVIRGFVDLTDQDDRFFNQAGGVFEAKLTSDFGLGTDVFRNERGGTVQAATDPELSESTVWARLELLNNFGVISMEDASAGDRFRVSSSANPEQYGYFFDSGIVFNGGSGSTLAVDSFLGGPGSTSDIFIIDGDVTGKTVLTVNNTNPGPGVFNPEGIPVVFVGGNVKSDAFFLQQSIDTGFFNYDLFFVPANSGFFELRSFVGGGALLLPQLVTAAQDIWHAGSSTWFDRTADLRVLLNGGAAPGAYDPALNSANGMAQGAAMTPAVWARGSGNWLDRERSQTVTAYGRDYRFNLDRDLEIIDFQMGLDLGKRDLLAQGDILVFGMLGGFVGADLDYNQLARGFDFEGGQIGGYATYLRGGLFVDTLLNAHLLELETATLGFPSSLD
ncbi:MAG TPA: hypothetical protein VNO69_12920, partial [Methyloceanibacter sp.]|nr:hypothetical protein [Methyloceanibacter sp.]